MDNIQTYTLFMYLFLYPMCIIMFCHRILKVHLGSIEDIYKTGIDERVIYHSIINNQEPTSIDIHTNLHKQKVLELLVNQNINIHIKLQTIDKYNDLFVSREHFLHQGKLFEDWEFDF